MNTELNPPSLTDHPPEDIGENCPSLPTKVDDAVSVTRSYAHQNPLPAMLGALAFGAALGYMLVMARREEPKMRERFRDEPLQTAREAIFAVLAPVASRLHESYDSTRENAGKIISKLHHAQPARTVDSWFDQLGRVSSNLKFW